VRQRQRLWPNTLDTESTGRIDGAGFTASILVDRQAPSLTGWAVTTALPAANMIRKPAAARPAQSGGGGVVGVALELATIVA